MPVCPLSSVAVTVIGGKAPPAVGVPESTPLLLRFMPAGREPPVTAKVYGSVPPLAEKVTGL